MSAFIFSPETGIRIENADPATKKGTNSLKNQKNNTVHFKDSPTILAVRTNSNKNFISVTYS